MNQPGHGDYASYIGGGLACFPGIDTRPGRRAELSEPRIAPLTQAA